MAKNTANNNARGADDVQETYDDIGGAAKGVQTKEVDPFENLPAFVVDKNWSKGRTICGKYLSSKLIYSDKFTAGRIDPQTGKMCRMRHILEDVNSSKRFVVWGVGSLNVIMNRLAEGQYVELTFTGKADKPLKPGQSAPYTFKVKSDKPLRDPDLPIEEMAHE
jgi:hypothetical protein